MTISIQCLSNGVLMPLGKSEDVGLPEDRGVNQGESSVYSACSTEHTQIALSDHPHPTCHLSPLENAA